MNSVDFDEESSSFILSLGGFSYPFHYIPSRKDIWLNMKDEDFEVVLLNNPFLYKETDYFELEFDGSGVRDGYIFPIALLESEEDTDKILRSYMYVSYRILLNGVTNSPTGVLSDSFKDAFVLVVNKRTKVDFCIENYILSLAGIGFYSYKGVITKTFPQLSYFKGMVKTLKLEQADVDNLRNGYVHNLISEQLVRTSDFLTRFVLIYQVVELYITEIHQRLLDEKIKAYQNGKLKRNDFSVELINISKEAYQVEDLSKEYHQETVCLEYIKEVVGLFNDIGYDPKSKSISALLYALRNHIFHNYSIFVGHEEQLNDVIFRFERVILFILMKKMIK